jgi:hypothetical protein
MFGRNPLKSCNVPFVRSILGILWGSRHGGGFSLKPPRRKKKWHIPKPQNIGYIGNIPLFARAYIYISFRKNRTMVTLSKLQVPSKLGNTLTPDLIITKYFIPLDTI